MERHRVPIQVRLFVNGDFKTELLQNAIRILRIDLDGGNARQHTDKLPMGNRVSFTTVEYF